MIRELPGLSTNYALRLLPAVCSALELASKNIVSGSVKLV